MSSWTAKLQGLKPCNDPSSSRASLYLVSDFLNPGDRFMLKQMKCSTREEADKAFRAEQIAIENPHKHICESLEVHQEDDGQGGFFVYIRMKQMTQSLFDEIEERQRSKSYFTEGELWRMLREAMSAYTFLQQRTVAHRDIKPHNILLDAERHLKVCDFDFAKRVDSKAPEVNTLLGTMPYYSPAVRKAFVRNEDHPQHNPFKSDVYSLGICMLHASLLRLPPELTKLARLQETIEQTLSYLTYSKQWRKVLKQMLTVKEEDRPDFQQLSEAMKKELEWGEGEPGTNVNFQVTPLLVSMKCGLSYVRIDSRRFEEVPCMVSLHAINAEPYARAYATDIVCVIDESGSMDASMMKLVKNTLSKLVQMLRDTDRLSLITFSDTAVVRCPLIACDKQGKSTIYSVIERLVGRGNTNIAAGLSVATEIMEQRQFPNTGAAILLFSDGLNNVGGNPVPICSNAILKPALQNANVRIHTFGYGSQLDTNLMTMIAQEGCGNFRHLQTPASIPEAFALAFAEIVTIVAKNVDVTLSVHSNQQVDFNIGKIYSKDGSPLYHLPDITANQTKDLIFFIKAPYLDLQQGVDNMPTITAHVKYFDMHDCEMNTSETLLVSCVPWGGPGPQRDANVFVNWSRVKGADIIREARELATNNRIEEACNCLSKSIDDIASDGYEEHPLVSAIIHDLESALKLLQSAHGLDRNADAQLAMVSYSHQSQIGVSMHSPYTSKQQKHSMNVMTNLSTISEVSSAPDTPTMVVGAKK